MSSELFDRMLAIDVRPFVELGFCPGPLATKLGTVFWWKGNGSPPTDLVKWKDLIAALTYLMIDGHGSTRALVSSGGTITARYDYDAFGDALDFDETTAVTPGLFGGDGLYDPSTGCTYQLARWRNGDVWCRRLFGCAIYLIYVCSIYDFRRTCYRCRLHRWIYRWIRNPSSRCRQALICNAWRRPAGSGQRTSRKDSVARWRTVHCRAV